MTHFSECNRTVIGLYGLWLLLLIWGSVLLFALGIRTRRTRYIILPVICFAVVYSLFQCVILYAIPSTSPAAIEHFAAWIGALPTLIPFTLCAAMTAFGFVFVHHIRRWEHGNITPQTLKKAVDSLPSALCFYGTSGRVILKNRAMDALCRVATGEPLLNGNQFSDYLNTSCTRIEGDRILPAPNGKAYFVTEEQVSDPDGALRMITAADVTDAYRNMQNLSERCDALRKSNRSLTAYGREIAAMITDRETLNAKSRLHDALGLTLLRSRHYIRSGGTPEEREAILQGLRTSISCLRIGTRTSGSTEYDRLLTAARSLGLEIRISGPLPEGSNAKRVLTTAMHECMTNTLRHAHGDLLNVEIAESDSDYEFILTNSGRPPSDPITEKGGLANLRTLTERYGGSMSIDVSPYFRLHIRIPKEAM